LFLEIQHRVRARFVEVVREVFSVEISEPALGYPPSVDLGELSITSCFELAKQLRQPPRKIAEQLAPRLLPIEGVERVSVAGAGYLNFHFNRASLAGDLFRVRSGETGTGSGSVRDRQAQDARKILVEHTSINPNKAAHIGHLRNAVLGDSFVRLLRFRGHTVEVENYIDNTGVQVADVVVGFVHLEKKAVADVRRLIDDPAIRFDYYCWDLYARVFQHYENHEHDLARRAEALKAIEEGHGDLATMADLISTAIVRAHLETMQRVNVKYDLLVQESEILRLDFWKSAFELMKKTGAIRFEDSGKNQGCWVMSLEEADGSAAKSATASPELPEPKAVEEDVKVIVRSNGTVTYVGKDIAYHLWKFGLLGKDFGYERFYAYPDGHSVWRTSIEDAGSQRAGNPAFGKVAVAYAVIDTRQSYVQNVVRAAFHAVGYHQQAANLHHLDYGLVGLSLRCVKEMGSKFKLPEFEGEEDAPGYVVFSGRKGLGIKADDLIQQLIEKAAEEVRSREMTRDPAEQNAYATMIAVGALRYFLLKFTRRSIIAFDFKEALAFEGETGPYLQYSLVRARNIFRKFGESHADFQAASLGNKVSAEELKDFLAGEDGRSFWEMTLLAAQLEMSAEQAIDGEEPAVVAKYAFRLAQAFNNFYHHHHILNEPDPARQKLLLYLVELVNETLWHALDLLGIEVPEKM
jgi:arginyl-tRNA synthetase